MRCQISSGAITTACRNIDVQRFYQRLWQLCWSGKRKGKGEKGKERDYILAKCHDNRQCRHTLKSPLPFAMRFSHRTNIIPRLNRQAYHQGKGKEEVTKNRKKERGEREKVYLLFNFTKACNCCTVSMQCGPRSPIVSTCKERAGQKRKKWGNEK